MGNTLWARAPVANSGTSAPTAGTPGTAAVPESIGSDTNLEVLVLGTGGGRTYVFSREPSSSFVVLKGGEPVLMCDVGYGTTFACTQHLGRLPKHIYVSHNHGDHTGELPVVLAVEREAAAEVGHEPPYLYCHPDVMREVRQHRLRELLSTGKPQELFATFVETPSCCTTPIADTGLTVRPFLTSHSETCYGFVLYDEGRPVLGWTADSGYDEELYGNLAEAPVLLLDARAKGSKEHAGFDDLPSIAALPYMRDKTVYITGYGMQLEAPEEGSVAGAMRVAHPGMRIPLGQPPACGGGSRTATTAAAATTEAAAAAAVAVA